MSYFGLRLLFFAISISPYVPPDEVMHLGISKIFSRAFLLPDNSPETYQYGLVTNIPWLYYWIMGKLLALNILGIPDLLFLRLLNIPMAFGTVFFSWRILRLLTDNRLSQLVLVVAVTNTLMFSFLSASITYDNLTNLLAAMAIYYLLAFFRERSGHLLGLSLFFQLAGCLTKVSFLPLLLILNLLLIVREFRELRRLPSAAITYYRDSGWRGPILSLAVFLGLFLNLQLYGGNYLQFGKINPEFIKILPMESAMQYRLAARETILDLFMEERISFQQAMDMASNLHNVAARANTLKLLRNIEYRRHSGGELLGPVAYILPWAKRMSASVFGILGQLLMFNEGVTLLPVAALIACAGFSIIWRWRPGDAAGFPIYLAVTFAAYTIFILYAVNYRIYLYYGDFNIALQGRYIFPVIGPFYVLFSYYLMLLFKGKAARAAVAFAAALGFIVSDFPFFLYHATPYWFGPLILF